MSEAPVIERWSHELEIVCGDRRVTVSSQGGGTTYWSISDFSVGNDPTRLDRHWRQGGVHLSGLGKKKAREVALNIVKMNEQKAIEYARRLLRGET